jgi:uncharacterized repeat protein (TIGR01451 family)
MSRKLLTAIGLLTVAGCVVAMVRAQERPVLTNASTGGPSYSIANRPSPTALAQASGGGEHSVLTRRPSGRTAAANETRSAVEPSRSLEGTRIAERLRQARDTAASGSTTVTRRPLGAAVERRAILPSAPVETLEEPETVEEVQEGSNSEEPARTNFFEARRMNETLSPAPSSEHGADAEPLPMQADGELISLSTTGPTLRVDATGPRAILLGQPAEYTLTVVNEGSVDANEVYVRVGIPSWVEIKSTEGTSGTAQVQEGSGADRRIVWTVKAVLAGKQEMLRIRCVPREQRAFDLAIDWTVSPTTALASIQIQQPQLKVAVIGPKEIQYGETGVFTIQLSNPGSGRADGVELEFAYGGQRLPTREVGSIEAGQQVELTVELTARQAGTLPVAAVAKGIQGLRADASQNVIVRRAELKVEVVGTPRQFAGSVGTYRILIRNSGNAPASDLTARAILPPGTTAVAAGDFGPGEDGVIKQVGPLAAGAERVLTLQAQLNQPGEQTVQVMVEDVDGLAVAGSYQTRVEALADLALQVTDPKGPTALGREATYEIIISNRGTKAAEGVNVVAQFSEGVEPVQTQGAKADLVPGQAIFHAIPRIDPGQSLTLKVIAKADREGNHRFRAELTADGPETKLVAEESTYYFRDASR